MLVNEIIDDLRVKLADFPGMRVFLQNPPTVQLGGQVTKSPYQFSLYAPDKKELYAFAAKLEKEVAQVPGLIDVTSDLQISSPQVNVQIDRDRAAAVHVSAQQIENALYDAYGPRWVSTIYAAVNEYKVLLELKPEYQKDPKALSLLYFKSTRRPAGATRLGGSPQPGNRASDDQPLRTASSRHHLLQRPDRRTLGQRGGSDSGHYQA